MRKINFSKVQIQAVSETSTWTVGQIPKSFVYLYCFVASHQASKSRKSRLLNAYSAHHAKSHIRREAQRNSRYTVVVLYSTL